MVSSAKNGHVLGSRFRNDRAAQNATNGRQKLAGLGGCQHSSGVVQGQLGRLQTGSAFAVAAPSEKVSEFLNTGAEAVRPYNIQGGHAVNRHQFHQRAATPKQSAARANAFEYRARTRGNGNATGRQHDNGRGGAARASGLGPRIGFNRVGWQWQRLGLSVGPGVGVETHKAKPQPVFDGCVNFESVALAKIDLRGGESVAVPAAVNAQATFQAVAGR